MRNCELLYGSIKEYIEIYFEEFRRSPSLSEIGEKFNLPRTTVHRYLHKMSENGDIFYYGDRITTEKIEKMSDSCVSVALVGEIACGTPVFAEENIEKYFSLPTSLIGNEKFFLLRAKGNSMIDIGINNGDLVLVRQQNFADKGQIVVALCDDSEATLKRYFPEPENKRIRLHPENRDMSDIFVDRCIVQGVAVKVLKDII